MTVIQLILFFVCFVVAACFLYWIITKFLPAPAQMPILAVVGVVLIIIFLTQFFPELGNYRVWR